MPPDPRQPPGAPRKQHTQPPPSRITTMEQQVQAGPSRARGETARVASSTRSISGGSASSYPSLIAGSHDQAESAAAAATAAAMFGSNGHTRYASDTSRVNHATPRHVSSSAATLPPAPHRRDGNSWLSRRLHGRADTIESSAQGLTEGHDVAAASAMQAAGPSRALPARGRDTLDGALYDTSSFATPTNLGQRASGNERSLLTQITRRLAAARRPHAREQHTQGQRASLLGDDASIMQAGGVLRLHSAPHNSYGVDDDGHDLINSAAGHGRTRASDMEERRNSATGNRGNGASDQLPTWNLRAPPPPFPRFGGATTSIATTNHDGSFSVVRDEAVANNSGLLALTPAMRRMPGFAMTSMRSRGSKTSSDLSFAPGPGETSKGARSSEPSDRSLGMQPSIIEYDLEGVDVASVDEMEARRAHLLHDAGPAEVTENAALLETMRSWREDAMKHHLYDTAIFWGNKILSMEASQLAWNDAYNLATAYFLTHRYAQAEHLLCSPVLLSLRRKHQSGLANGKGLTESSPDDFLDNALQNTYDKSRLPDHMLAASSQFKRSGSPNLGDDPDSCKSQCRYTGKRKTREFTVSGAGSASEAGSVGINGNDDVEEEESRQHAKLDGSDGASLWSTHDTKGQKPAPDAVSLVDVSIPCKYLAAQCMVRQAKYQEALDELDLWAQGADDEAFGASCRQPSKDGLIKLSSSIWHLKGLTHLHLRHVEAAKECFIKSVSLDVKNFESFDQLVRGNLLTSAEQWRLVDSLQYAAQAGQDEVLHQALHMVQLMYTSLLDKGCKEHIEQTALARRELGSRYGLSDNPDVLLGLAEELFARLRFRDTYHVTQRIMELSKDHEAALPIHITSMQMMPELLPSLYLLAHHLTSSDPDLPAAWYAVGCWYFATKRWLEARKHFSKSVQIDPRFAPGWVAFAHTFAHEGESDQAIVSYSTAERNFSSNHLIKLYLGMEHLHQDNLTLAQLYLEGSAEVWEEDPLSRNERGVVAYYNGKLDEAIVLFRGALEASKESQQPATAWASTHLNLGHALRRLHQYEEASKSYLCAGDLDPDCDAAFVGLGLCCHVQGHLDEALDWYNRALAVNPGDKHARELSQYVLRESARVSPSIFAPPFEDEQLSQLRQRKLEQEAEAQRLQQANANDDEMTGGEPASADGEAADTNGVEKHGEASGSLSLSLAEGSASIDMDE